jgi:hypothetical protein
MRDLGVDPVEVHRRVDHVGVLARREQRELPAHAEAHHADRLRLHRVVRAQELGGGAQVLRHARDVERHEQLARLVRARRALALVEIRGERHEPAAATRSAMSWM